MYDTLKPHLLTASASEQRLMRLDPTAVVQRDLFLENQFPYHEVRRPFILGTQEQKWKATIFHRFVEILHQKGKLKTLFTQNIDGLDFQTSIPPEKIIGCHGTIAQAACEACGHPMDFGKYCNLVRTNIKDIYGVDKDAPEHSSPITCEACGGNYMKPTTVMFGGDLPDRFFTELSGMSDADLVLIAGTSLVVSPANLVAFRAPKNAIRVVCDRNDLSESGMPFDFTGGAREDVWLAGDSDDVFLKIAQECGWLSDLQKIANLLPEESRSRLEAAS
jgi:NAD-dependent SIR2 family protein deacetylase